MQSSTMNLFEELHEYVQLAIVSYLDNRTLRHFSCCSKACRTLALMQCHNFCVPTFATRQELLSFTAARFPCAKQLTFRGEYKKLRPADFDGFIKAWQSAQITRLIIKGVQLSGPVAVSTMDALCKRWQSLQHLEMHDVRFTCPLECTDPVALDGLIRRLYAMQGKPLPHITILRNQVQDHEMNLECNLLVTSKVFEAISQLQNLQSLVICSPRYMAPHNEAVAYLKACSKLTHFTLQVPSAWPYVTVHGLRQLPTTLKQLTLVTTNAVRAWRTLASLTRPGSNSQYSPTGTHNSSPTGVRSPVLSPSNSWGLQESYACTNAYHSQFDEAPLPSRAGLQVCIDGRLSGSEQALPDTGLPSLPALKCLTLVSSCKEAAEPEDPDEPIPENPEEIAESVVLAAMLAAAPRLSSLTLTNAGPVLTRTVAGAASHVPTLELVLACQSRVDVRPLILSAPAAQLHLQLKSISTTDLNDLVAAASNSSGQHGLFGSLGVSETQRSDLSVVGKYAAHPASDSSSYSKELYRSRVASLHFQKSQELTDLLVTEVLAALPSVSKLTLHTCRNITCDVVVEAAKLRRPIRLCVEGCRLVTRRGWEAAVKAAREVPGSCLVDVKYDQENMSFEVAFE